MTTIVSMAKNIGLKRVIFFLFFLGIMSIMPLLGQVVYQENLVYQESGAQIEVGDSVIISRDSTHYATRERIAHWVFDEIHIVRQVGSKYHPNAVLVKGIYSWIPAGAAIPMNKNKMVLPIAKDTMPNDTIIQEKLEFSLTEDTIVKTTEFQPYQLNRFTLGLRGGFATTVGGVPASATLPIGFDARIDLQYAHYWVSKKRCLVGVMMGASVGYMNTTRNQAWDEIFLIENPHGGVEYHVTADNICETNHQLQLEMPLMLSIITNRKFFFNIGPRVLVPIYTPYKQIITNGKVVAKDIETGVTVWNNPIYGIISDEQLNMKGNTKQQYMLTLNLSVELGYEFEFKSGNSIGLGVYANYGLYNVYNSTINSVINVTPPHDNKIGVVNVESLTNACTNKMGNLDAGIKLNFNFDFMKKSELKSD